MGWFGVVSGHSRSLEIQCSTSAYEFLLAFSGNCDPVLHRFWDHQF